MKLKTGCNIHNRFILEVRDKETNELKQTGIAENIILDRAYTRVCNLQTYFSYIHFGTGTGPLSTARTTLFSKLGHKSVTVEEKVKAYPVSRITKSITLTPEEYVGEAITEVGISETTSAINTHALIKDAEGNPLSIVKTALDVVIIYATVFIELENPDDDRFYFYNLPDNNALINYFVDGTSPTRNISVGVSDRKTNTRLGYFVASKSPTSTVGEKKVTFATRFNISDANVNTKRISEIALTNILMCKLPLHGAFEEYFLEDVAVGIGDGETVRFQVPHEFANGLEVKINGVPETNYIYNRGMLPDTKHDPVDINNHKNFGSVISVSNAFLGYAGQAYYAGSMAYLTLEREADMSGYKLGVARYPSGRTGEENLKYRIEGSHNNSSWVTLTSGSEPTYQWGDFFMKKFPDSVNDYRYIRLGVGGVSYSYGGDAYAEGFLGVPDDENIIIFDTPPPADAVITASYTVPYIPKTADYVLDVEFELQFGEGV